MLQEKLNMTNRISLYTQRLSVYNSEKQKLQKKQNPLPMLRLTLFLGMAILTYIYLTTQTLWSISLVAFAFFVFVVLSIFDSKLKKQIKSLEILIGINQYEVSAINGNYSSFDPGNEFIDQSHDYSHDLDIFGEGSLFQFINRTSTIFGKLRLAEYFSNAYGQSDKVVERQKAVKELSEMVELRQNLQLIFNEEKISESDKTEMNQWIESESPVQNMKLLQYLAYGLPFITMIWIALSIIGILSFPIFLIVLQLMVVFLYGKQTIKVQNIITSKSRILNRYAQCLHIIESTGFKSNYLTDLQKKIAAETKQSPSESIHELSTILKYMDSNLNLLVSVILNGLFMFNLHLLLNVEKWKKQNQENVPNWFESIATFDAMCSLANFAFNNNQFIYPDLIKDDFGFIAENLGHPLIDEEQRVVNNIEIKGWNQFAIITGANMSGKSTFLRTIGANYILAMAGAPVCASQLSFFPIEIHSSIRTSDSLVKHESYFYAELKRLKQIIDELESGKKKLILLDEILKGTNSKDKQAGSIALIAQLLHYKSVGLFATHDLMLGELATRFPGQVNNLCFEIQIENDKMLIDYKLHDGVCKNLNATYLMKNMGILFENKN